MQENILQVPEFETASRLPNDLHIGFVTTQKEQLDAAFDPESPAPGKLPAAITAFSGTVAQEDQSYIISRASDLTAQIAEQDNIRDDKQGQVKTMADAYAKMTALPQMQQAALTFKTLWDKYSPDAKAAYEVQTTALTQWYDEYQQTPAAVQAAQTLGLDTIIADMMQANSEVHRLYVLRDQQQGEQQASTMPLKDARAETDRAYRWLVQLLNAYALVDNDPDRFRSLVIGLTQTQQSYRDLYDERQRNNRRVYVESTVVGNHYYTVSAGWTWATLAQKNPKALALDPEPSAPGVEPVVSPVRIVSADKKALKAGGLAVALKGGAIVSPADEADPKKQYQLVPYNQQSNP